MVRNGRFAERESFSDFAGSHGFDAQAFQNLAARRIIQGSKKFIHIQMADLCP
jgi:hypothetical protein